MATYNQGDNQYVLEAAEITFEMPALPPSGIDADALGNDLDNEITGNSGDNFLDGGLGADTLEGGLGDDSYLFDDVGDTVIELADGGADWIQASTDLDLSVAAFVNIEAAGLVGGDDLDLTGNDLANALYGNVGNNMLFGGKGDDFLSGGGGGLDKLAGGEGNDIYYIDDVSTIVIENDAADIDLLYAIITIDLRMAKYANVENVTLIDLEDRDLTGTDHANWLRGNLGLNSIVGGSGNDTLEGGGGGRADTLKGGEDDDTYIVHDTEAQLFELVNEGTDQVEASVSYILKDHFEHLLLTGDQHIDGTGNGDANFISGNEKNNRLDGKGGADELMGGDGDDVFVIDHTDIITEDVDEGRDTVEIAAAYDGTSYTLTSNFENLTLTGTRDFDGTGNAADNNIIGNAGRNVLSGDAGADTLNGGAGADVLVGGTGDDLYIVDSTNDVVTELATGGAFDRVITRATFMLGANLEYLAMENGAGNIGGTGNALDNTMFGNDGNNVLDGGGGRDQLNGATGNDTIYGGDGDDTLNESGDGNDVLNGGAGADDIRAEGGNDLLDGGIGADLLKGGAGDDTVYGGEGDDSISEVGLGNDVLNGGAGVDTILADGGNDLLDGGTGADVLKGGAGNDTYLVDDALDIVVEDLAGGTDLVKASTSFALAAASSIETLMAAAGVAAINLSGNENGNVVVGNDGKNLIGGMAGNDVLSGGKGKDTFVFTSALGKNTNLDRITDFSVKDDGIQLENLIFKKLGKGTANKPGKLNKAFFTFNKAKDKNDYLIYKSKTGVLAYDSDGSGKAKAVDFAVLKMGLKLAATDFFVI